MFYIQKVLSNCIHYPKTFTSKACEETLYALYYVLQFSLETLFFGGLSLFKQSRRVI